MADKQDREGFRRLIGPDGRAQRGLTDAEADDWAAFIADVAPLAKDVAPAPAPPKLRFDTPPRHLQSPPAEHASAPPLARGLERSVEKRLRRGDIAIDGQIDLHGMTAERARTALARFLRQKQMEGARCVLVVTGKGQRLDSGGKPGVIRTALPAWLAADDLRGLVFAHRSAHVKHGGDGASYVFIRKMAKARS